MSRDSCARTRASPQSLRCRLRPVRVDLQPSRGMIAVRSTLLRSRVCPLVALALGVGAWVSLASTAAATAATVTVTVNPTKDKPVRHQTGAHESAIPEITILAPFQDASYERGS